MDIVLGLFFVVVAAVAGGFLAKLLKVPGLVGYIVAGIVIGAILPPQLKVVSGLAQIGIILLLFSIGVELSFDRLSRYLRVAVFGALIQIVLVTLFGYIILSWFGFPPAASLVLSLGFSISSTAVLVKILGDRGEVDTIHGEIMLSWSLVQDLAVIPIMVALPFLAASGGGLGYRCVSFSNQGDFGNFRRNSTWQKDCSIFNSHFGRHQFQRTFTSGSNRLGFRNRCNNILLWNFTCIGSILGGGSNFGISGTSCNICGDPSFKGSICRTFLRDFGIFGKPFDNHV